MHATMETRWTINPRNYRSLVGETIQRMLEEVNASFVGVPVHFGSKEAALAFARLLLRRIEMQHSSGK